MPSPAPTAGTCRVVLCRGCCCGTLDKHPDTDHRLQVDQLRAAAGLGLVVTGCLGNCERSNTIVVLPSPAGRAAGGRVTWLGSILDAALTQAVAGWIAAGGPGLADPPTELASHVQPPGRRIAAAASADAR